MADGLDQGLAVGLDREVLQPLPVCEITASVQLAAWTSIPMYRSIGASSRWVLLISQLEDSRRAREAPPSASLRAHGSPCRRHTPMMLIPGGRRFPPRAELLRRANCRPRRRSRPPAPGSPENVSPAQGSKWVEPIQRWHLATIPASDVTCQAYPGSRSGRPSNFRPFEFKPSRVPS